MGGAEGTAVPISVGGLDGTTARSVTAFLDARHSGRFEVVGRADARIVLVDLDQPGAEVDLAAVVDGQLVIGVGFEAEPRLDGCRTYAQKPLTGSGLIDALDEVIPQIRSGSAKAPTVIQLDRPSHARDVFTKGRAYTRPFSKPRPAPAWTQKESAWRPPPPAAAGGATTLERPDVHRPAPPEAPAARDTAPPAPRPVRLDRDVHDRAPRLTDVGHSGSTGSAAEHLGQRLDVAYIEARDAGDLNQPSVLATYRYTPVEHLDGKLREVARQHVGQVWELRSPAVSIIADPIDDTVLVAGSDVRLQAVCAAPLVPSDWEVVVRRRPPEDGHLRRMARTSLQWNLSVWCSQGRLSDDIDPFAVSGVQAWPDLTRMVLTPSTLPIVALLAAGPVRLVDVPARLGISRTHVFVVLSALDNLGLLTSTHGWAPGTVAPAQSPTIGGPEPGAKAKPARGVLRRLLGRLRDA